jgi:predicted metal-binding membrane protein
MTLTTGSHASKDTTGAKVAASRGWPLVLAVIVLLSLAGWAYLTAMVADMVPAMDMSEAGPGMGVFNAFNLFAGLPDDARAALAVLCLPAGATFGMPGTELTLIDLGKIFLMWAMMALAMMLPTAIPMLRGYFNEMSRKAGAPRTAVIAATLGYLAVWLGYAVIATAAQWALSRAGALNDMMAPASMALTTSVLIAAGLYQFTPAKWTCLARCWYPRWAFARNDVPGVSAGFREGLVQGWACLGCCWAVMTVMFAVGLMNIIWIALLGGVMALEKTFPSRFAPYAIGAVLLAWGGGLAALLLSGGLAA